MHAATRKLIRSIAATSIVAFALFGCSSGPVQNAGPPESPRLDTYLIGIPDLLSIKIWEQPGLSGDALVRRDGKISVPLVGDVIAAGQSPEALARNIETALARFVTNPRVDVSVLEMRSQVVSIIGGGIMKSGVIELRSDMRVIDAIAEMGGLTPFAKQKKIRVVRGENSYLFDYSAFMKGDAAESNFLLAPGDTVIVPE